MHGSKKDITIMELKILFRIEQPTEPGGGEGGEGDSLVLSHRQNLPKAKSIDSGQPARTAQADLSRYFLANVSNLLLLEPAYDV